MSLPASQVPEKSRLGVLLEHFACIDDPRDVRRIAHPLAEILLLVVCGTMADYDHIAAWGEAHLDFLRRHLPFQHGVPGGRWLTILMNRINTVGRPKEARDGRPPRRLTRWTGPGTPGLVHGVAPVIWG